MSNHCKIEFYFKAEQMLELLKRNPDAKGIIIRQEIKPRKSAEDKGFTNVTAITAYTTGGNSTRTLNLVADAGGDEDSRPIDGCPYPPGCNLED